MNKLLVAILCIAVCSFLVSAGEKVLTFSGNITYFDDENRSIIAHNGKKEMSFFVAGNIVHGDNRIDMADLRKGCTVTVTYQKSKKRLVASRVDVKECLAINR
jgi:hypothetical protein